MSYPTDCAYVYILPIFYEGNPYSGMIKCIVKVLTQGAGSDNLRHIKVANSMWVAGGFPRRYCFLHRIPLLVMPEWQKM